MKKIDRLLWIVIAIIILFIIFGTAIAFTSGKATMGENLRKEDPSPTTITNTSNEATSVYSQIGLLRCGTTDIPSIPIVVNPYFPYPSDDTAFYEELFKKNKKMRLVIIEYFESFTQNELSAKGEETIKLELIHLLNMELVLGKIENLYFAEYIFLE